MPPMRRNLSLPLALLAATALVACEDDGPHDPSDAAAADTDAVGDTDGGDATGDPDPEDNGDGGGPGDADTSDVVDPPDEREAILAIPETRRLTLPGLTGEVHVVRTEGNIPHVYATNEQDLYRAAGFVMAQDRYFEFELARRLSLGRLAELLGDLGIGTDLDSRGQGITYVADRIVANLDAETGAIFDAYAAGVNAYLDAVRAGELPPPSELALVGPLLGVADPTTVLADVDRRDIAGFAAFVVYQSGYSEDDLAFERTDDAVAAYDPVGQPRSAARRIGLRDEIWRRPQGVWDTTSVPGFGLNGSAEKSASQPRLSSPRGSSLRVPASLLDAALERQAWWNPNVFRRLGDDWGSNVWAVAGDHTVDGAALLAGDGHLSLGIPTLFFQMGLDTRTFGAGTLRERGLYLPGFPFLGVGTNGRVAWSQTYPSTDVVDWYAEEIRLDEAGMPNAARFDERWVELVRVDETYVVAGTLGAATREVTWPRWTTADGRWLQSIEGTEVEDPDTIDLEPGHSLVQMRGTYVIPADLNDDGIVSALSMDYTAFDIGNMGGAIRSLGASQDVAEFRERTRAFVGYAQNLIAADALGGIMYSFHSALPCRQYLDRTEDGWGPGADPTRVLDGRHYGGFTIPLDSEGMPAGAFDDAYRCVVPFEDWPSALRPDTGYLMNANNDPAGLTLDGQLGNDLWHLGGPWSLAFRAWRIDEVLASQAAGSTASLESMQALQGDHTSLVGARIARHLVTAVGNARAWSLDEGVEDWQLRAAEAYLEHAVALEEAAQRLSAWVDRGAVAASGVDTFYHAPDDTDRDDAVATMIFNEWVRQLRRRALGDETFSDLPGLLGTQNAVRTLVWMLDGRGDDNPLDLSSWVADTGESAFFDDINTAETERSDELIVLALVDTIAALSETSRTPGRGGFGTDEMSQWLWGLRHQVRFESILVGFASGNPLIDVLAADFSIGTQRLPLAPRLANDDPRRGLDWFPRPGDLYSVDAARPGLGGDYTYAQGPVMRMVIALYPDGRIEGANILPGGQSGLTDSPHFDDQAALWLGNQTWPLRYAPAQVAEGAVGREVLVPR